MLPEPGLILYSSGLDMMEGISTKNKSKLCYTLKYSYGAYLMNLHNNEPIPSIHSTYPLCTILKTGHKPVLFCLHLMQHLCVCQMLNPSYNYFAFYLKNIIYQSIQGLTLKFFKGQQNVQ